MLSGRTRQGKLIHFPVTRRGAAPGFARRWSTSPTARRTTLLGELASVRPRARATRFVCPAAVLVRNHGGMAVALVGATASGKSALAHEFALESRRRRRDPVRRLNDGLPRAWTSAPPRPHRRSEREVNYHLLDLIEPDEEFTVAQFQHAAREAARPGVGAGRIGALRGGHGSLRACGPRQPRHSRAVSRGARATRERAATTDALYEELAAPRPRGGESRWNRRTSDGSCARSR